jgi:hypothetical protein
MKARKIKTKVQLMSKNTIFELNGHYNGKQTYLWFGDSHTCYGILNGAALLRLAKTIVREFER